MPAGRKVLKNKRNVLNIFLIIMIAPFVGQYKSVTNEVDMHKNSPKACTGY